VTQDVLWTIKEAALAARVSVEFLRRSDCPRCYLSNKPGGRALVRFVPEEVRAWAAALSTSREVA